MTTPPLRVLFVFAWLVVGGEETEVRLLSRLLDPKRFNLEVIACYRREGMPDQTEHQLEALGVPIDRTPYTLSFDDTVRYLADRLPLYDVVVGCQAVRDLEPAMRLAHERGDRVPPVIEHGGLVVEAERASPLVARYVGVCDSIRAAAAARLGARDEDVLEIPSMVDFDEFDPRARAPVRAELRLIDDDIAFGWVGRLDRKKRVEDFLDAAAIVRREMETARFFVIGGPDAFMPEYADDLQARASSLGLDDSLTFLGDRPDVPRLLAGLDAFVWLARGEGMPHVIAEAGAAALPVIATPDNGTLEQLREGVTGLFVPHENPAAVAAAMTTLGRDAELRRRLGRALQQSVEARYSTRVVVPQWEALLESVVAEALMPA